MTVTQQNNRPLRLGIVAVLSTAWLYGLVQWAGHPNGAGATLVGLIGFAALGLVASIAPLEARGLRVSVRAFGTLIALGALALCALLVLLLRNGL